MKSTTWLSVSAAIALTLSIPNHPQARAEEFPSAEPRAHDTGITNHVDAPGQTMVFSRWSVVGSR